MIGPKTVQRAEGKLKPSEVVGVRRILDYLEHAGFLKRHGLAEHLQRKETFENVERSIFGLMSYLKLCRALDISPYRKPVPEQLKFRPIKKRLKEKIQRHREAIRDAERHLEMIKDEEMTDVSVSDLEPVNK